MSGFRVDAVFVLQGGHYPAHCLQYNSILSFPDSVLRAAGTNQHQVNPFTVSGSEAAASVTDL